MTNSNSPEIPPLDRTQILIAMGVTAVVLLTISKVWQKLGSIAILPISFSQDALVWSVSLAGGIILASSIVYRLWPAYRHSADVYLAFVVKPLIWADLIWLGLLPGMSEELLFRGVMLPAFGFNLAAVIVSSLLFGVLHLSGANQWPYVVWATAIGFVFGYVALITGNLLIPITAHIITNLISSSVWKIQHPTKIEDTSDKQI